MRVVRRVFVAAAVLVFTAAAAACSNSEGATTLDLSASTSSSPAAGTGSVEKWIAVFRTEADPHDMSDDTADVLAIVGGSIVVSPVACFEGLPADFHLDAYLLGVVAPTKDELDEVVATVGRTAIFEGQVRTMCLD
jgi:peptidoglycan/LPS O-acetylase OafA/YrhL